MEQRKVKVMTTVPNGIELSLRESAGAARYPGLRVQVPGAQTVQVGGAFALVDDGFMRAWLEQNQNSELVRSGALVIVSEDQPPPTDNIEQSDDVAAADNFGGDGGLAEREGENANPENGAAHEAGEASEEPQRDGSEPADDPKPPADDHHDGEPGAQDPADVQEKPESDKPADDETNGAEEGKAS